jgi:hypothetical protein
MGLLPSVIVHSVFFPKERHWSVVAAHFKSSVFVFISPDGKGSWSVTLQSQYFPASHNVSPQVQLWVSI